MQTEIDWDTPENDDTTRLDVGGAVLGLRLSQSCYRRLTWECELLEPSKAASLSEKLRALGYCDESRFSWVHELARPDGHHVIIVPRTGRIQIRIHYLTPFAQRQACALGVAREIASALN